MKPWLAFTAERGYAPSLVGVPRGVVEILFCRFLVYVTSLRYSYKHTMNMFYAARTAVVLATAIDPSDFVRVRLLRQGVRRLRKAPVKHKTPFTVADLLRLFLACDMTQHVDRTCFTIVSCLLFGLLRASECATRGPKYIQRLLLRDPRRLTLRYDNGRLVEVAFFIPMSKGDQMAHGFWARFYRTADPRICPVANFERMFAEGGGGLVFARGQPLFRRWERTHYVPITYSYLRSWFARRLPSARGGLTLHSPRAGGACALLAAGVPLPTLMIIGRWRGRGFIDYLHLAPSQRAESMQLIALGKGYEPGFSFAMLEDQQSSPEDVARVWREFSSVRAAV